MLGISHVVLDACVLVSFHVCDLLLKLAEAPPLHSPRWSARILDETCKAYANRKRNPWPDARIKSFRRALETAFPEAMVAGYEHLESSLTNDPKDRHVLAAAIMAQASAVVTFNLKDFPDKALAPWGMKAVHPSEYLLALYEADAGLVVSRLNEMAVSVAVPPQAILKRLAKTVPLFANEVAASLGWTLDDGE